MDRSKRVSKNMSIEGGWRDREVEEGSCGNC